MTITLDQFLADLPELVSGINNVVVATYNNLDSHENGGEFYTTGGRMVSIFCGGAVYADVEKLVGSNAVPLVKAMRMMNISKTLELIAPGSLVILYAGKSHFDEMLQLSRRLAERDDKVALVSCGCDDCAFDGVEPNENISLVKPTHGHCNGGRNDLSRIVARLL
jgi:hypothetical protein